MMDDEDDEDDEPDQFRASRQGFTQGYTAKLLDLTRTSVVNIEAGRQRIMLHTVVAIAVLLNTTPGKLVDKAIRRVHEAR